MTKSNVTLDEARMLVDRIAQEHGLLVGSTKAFLKVEGPTNKHRIYIQLTKKLGRIDTTLPLPAGEPGTRGLESPNGSVTCHIEPDLAHLERFLLMLADGSVGSLVTNKPRPFAPSKAPARRPTPIAAPVAPEELEDESTKDDDDPKMVELANRLDEIKRRSRAARIRRLMEDRSCSREEAEEALDGRTLSEAIEWLDSRVSLETRDAIREAGIEVEGL